MNDPESEVHPDTLREQIARATELRWTGEVLAWLAGERPRLRTVSALRRDVIRDHLTTQHKEKYMSIDTTMSTARAFARSRKEQLLGSTTHFLVALRSGRPVALLSSHDLNALVGLADIAAAGYAADALALVIEGVLPKVATHPGTGQPWRRGEAEALWRERDGVEQGWVSEAQIVAVALRDGQIGEEARPFHLAASTITWGDEPLDLTRSGLADALARRFGRAVPDESRVADPGDEFEGDPENGPFYAAEHGRVILDIGCSLVLGREIREHGEALLLVDSEVAAERAAAEGLPRWQVEVLPER